MKRFSGYIFAFVVITMLLLIAAVSWSETIILPGVACRPGWSSDVHLTGNASQSPGTQPMQLSYHTVEHPTQIWSVTETVQGGSSIWTWSATDLVCRAWGHLGATSGVLIVEAPFRLTGFAWTYTGDEFGAAVEASVPANAARPIVLPDVEPGQWRINLILYVDNDHGADILIGGEEVELPSRQAVIRLREEPGTVIWLDPAAAGQHVIVSLVRNNSGDPFNLRPSAVQP